MTFFVKNGQNHGQNGHGFYSQNQFWPNLTVNSDPSIAAELQAIPEPKNEIMEVERRRIKMRSDKNQIRYEVNNSSSYSASYQGPCSLGGRGDSAGVAGKPIRR